MKSFVFAVLLTVPALHGFADVAQPNSPPAFAISEVKDLSTSAGTDFTLLNSEPAGDWQSRVSEPQCRGCFQGATGPNESGSIALLVLGVALGIVSIRRRRA